MMAIVYANILYQYSSIEKGLSLLKYEVVDQYPVTNKHVLVLGRHPPDIEGLEVLFRRLIEGKELQFYAAATDIPPTKTLYNKDKKQITLEIRANQLETKRYAKSKHR